MVFREEIVPLGRTTVPGPEGRGKPEFTFVSSGDLFKPLPPRPYLVESLVPQGAIILVGGYGSSAKTWFALSLSLAVARGTPWLERFDVKQSQPSFLDYEAGEYETRRRLQALNTGLGGDGVPSMDICVYPAYTLNSPEFALAAERALETSNFVVIDSLRAATPGADENDSSIRGAVDCLKKLRNFDKSAIMILVHARKGQSGDIREQLRGSSATYDAADQAFFLKAEEDETFSCQQIKTRFTSKKLDFRFRVQDVDGNGVRLEEVTSRATGTVGVNAQLLKKVQSAIDKTPGIGARALRELVGGRGKSVDVAAAHLAESGIIKRLGHGYALVDASGDRHE